MIKVFLASCISADNPRQLGRIEQVKAALAKHASRITEYVYDRQEMSDKNTYSGLAQKILESDIYVAEMSLPSQTLGFQTSFALNNSKPCLYLYHTDTKGMPDAPLQGHPSRLLKIAGYDEKTLSGIIDSFIKSSQRQMASKRTSFMSTRQIDEFLSAKSKKNGTPKAEIIREVLDKATEEEK